MREIKFRAWDKKSLQMSPDFDLFGEFTLLGAVHLWQYESGNTNLNSLEALNDLEIMQFTGLLDRNGNEIYEGDLVKHGDELKEVNFKSGAFGIDVQETSRKHYDRVLHTTTWEIVGNIYENASLLKEPEPK